MNRKYEKFTPWTEYWDKKDIVNLQDRGNYCVYSKNNNKDIYLFCIHGAGHGALSYSLLCEQVSDVANVIAYDLKCHGETEGDPSKDLAIDLLVSDCAKLINLLIPKDKKLIIIGHSLGGSIAARVSHVVKAFAVVVLDTIEGTAIAAMPRMSSILSSRPREFKTQKEAISYLSSNGEMGNPKSAAVSALGRLKEKDGKYVWISNLMPSEHLWNDWFKGFADSFISSTAYKMLILPSVDYMDTKFVVGHMSGKFQLVIVNNSHHCVMEDHPEDIAQHIKSMVERLTEIPDWKALWGKK